MGLSLAIAGHALIAGCLVVAASLKMLDPQIHGKGRPALRAT
jgi:hypothetical protein